MKPLITFIIAICCFTATAQKSDTMLISSSFLNDDVIIYTVGDVYKTFDGSPWEDTVFNYIRIEDINNGWIKYTKANTIEGLDNTPRSTNKRRDFYKLHLKRSEWEIIFSDK